MRLSPWLGLLRSLAIYYHPARLAEMRRFYRGLLAPGDLAFDIGAHVGNRSRAMRAAGARVVALEPQPVFASFLRASLPRDITLHEAAAGPVESEAEMALSSRHPTVSSLSARFPEEAAARPGFGHVRWDRRQRVRVTTLDRLIAQAGVPRYIKIDVEGFEIEVLAGLSVPVEIISAEYLPGFPALSHAVIDRLCALGPYRFNVVVGEAAGFLWPDWRGAEALRAWLAGLPADATSGDIFARLVAPEAVAA